MQTNHQQHSRKKLFRPLKPQGKIVNEELEVNFGEDLYYTIEGNQYVSKFKIMHQECYH